jgi:hypothetical protein
MPKLHSQAEHDSPPPRLWGQRGGTPTPAKAVSKPLPEGRPRFDLALLGLLGLWILLILGLSK